VAQRQPLLLERTAAAHRLLLCAGVRGHFAMTADSGERNGKRLTAVAASAGPAGAAAEGRRQTQAKGASTACSQEPIDARTA